VRLNIHVLIGTFVWWGLLVVVVVMVGFFGFVLFFEAHLFKSFACFLIGLFADL
jgi:hypothetical protein